MSENLTLTQLSAFKGYGLLSRENIEYLVEIGEIGAKTIKSRRYYSVSSIESHINRVDTGIYKDFYSFNKAVSLVLKSDFYYRAYYQRFKNILDTFKIQIFKNNLTFKPSEYWIVKKSDIDKFNEEYISIQNFYNENDLNITLEHFAKQIKDNRIEILKFGRYFIWQFVKKRDLSNLVLLQKTHHVKQVQKELGIPILRFERVLEHYKIPTRIGPKATIVIDDANYKKLFDLQRKELEKHKDFYLNYSEIKQLFNQYGYKRPRGEVLSTFEKISVPDIIRINSYRGITNLYNKNQVMEYLNNRVEYKKGLDATTQLKYKVYDDNLDLFMKLLEVKNVIIDKNTETIALWMKFCERKILRSKHTTIENMIVDLCNSTITFMNFLRGKELSHYSTKEIDIGLFNSNDIPYTYKSNILPFIRMYNEELKRKKLPAIDVKALHFERKSIAHLKKETYTSQEYKSLLMHISNFDLHLKNSIEDYKKRGSHSDYADYWLYVLLHLNNAWRAADIRDFKYNNKSLVSKFNIKDIDEFYDLNLIEDDIDKIFYDYVVQEYYHSKNDAETELRISKNLRNSFAYCVIFLEWKNIKIKDGKNLIRFQNNKGTVASLVTRKKIFKDYSPNFKFQSRKFNRTLLTLVDEIFKEITGGENLFISRLLRGHLNEDTTYKHYLRVPQQRLDIVSLDIFDYGSFGYVYKKLISNLYDDSEWNKNSHTHVKNINNSFGDIFDIEQLALQINSIVESRKSVEHEISLLRKDQIKSILDNISLGLNPSKQKNIQCLFKQCVQPERECDLCPFSIPNMYSYINITKRFYRTLMHYLSIANDKDVPLGEKRRQYNLMAIDLEVVFEGANVFGEAYIESILDEDFNTLLGYLNDVGSPILIEGEI